MAEKTTINGVDIVEDGDVTHFTVSDDVKKQDEERILKELEEKAKEPSTWWGKIVSWFKKSEVKPYVKLRDLADPFDDRPCDDIDKGSDGKQAVEVGIKIGF